MIKHNHVIVLLYRLLSNFNSNSILMGWTLQSVSLQQSKSLGSDICLDSNLVNYSQPTQNSPADAMEGVFQTFYSEPLGSNAVCSYINNSFYLRGGFRDPKIDVAEHLRSLMECTTERKSSYKKGNRKKRPGTDNSDFATITKIEWRFLLK